MIQGFEKAQPLEPEGSNRFQWMPAVLAGLIAGLILLVIPRGSPWAAITFFAPVIMGRMIPVSWDAGFGTTSLVHLALAVIYSLIVSRLVSNTTQLRAVILGGTIGILLYLVNFGAVSIWFQGLRGHELSVILTHVVFGLIAAGAYRGLLRRQSMIAPPPT